MADHPGGSRGAAAPDATCRDAPRTPLPPRLPAVALDPRPVVAAGCVAWAVAAVVIAIVDGAGSGLLPVCYAGLIIGALGSTIFLIQRRGARAGRKGAQQGLG